MSINENYSSTGVYHFTNHGKTYAWSFQKQVVLKEETKNSLSYLHVSVIESRRLMKGIASTHLAPAFELGGSLPLKERSSR